MVAAGVAADRRSLTRFLPAGAAAAGGLVVTVLVGVAVAAPALTRWEGHDPYAYDLSALSDSGVPLGFGGGISATHWFGVEPLTGRDLFAVVVYGARTSLSVGLAAAAVALLAGVAAGFATGYLGGWFDRVTSRVIDVLLGFPALIFMIALGAVAPVSFPRPVLIVLVIGFFGWAPIARVVRGQTLALRERTFVVAAATLGAGTFHLLRHQYLPNLAPTIAVWATTAVPGMIGAEAALSFLGVGIPPPTPSWGRSINDAVAWLSVDPMFLVIPGAALLLTTLAFNLISDGLRDSWDPRRPGRRR